VHEKKKRERTFKEEGTRLAEEALEDLLHNERDDGTQKPLMSMSEMIRNSELV
jgi:hypothetical protein